MDPNLKKSIEGKKKELDKLRPLPKGIVSKLNEQFYLEWTYNSNAIEGNTLSLQETDLVLRQGITIGNKSLREHFEVLNHKEGIYFLEEIIKKKTFISVNLIREIHGKILKNIDDEQAGVFRSTNVRITGASHIPPSAGKIYDLMMELVEWYYINYKSLSIPEIAAWMHYKLVFIHPFIDGNGRTARLLMNLILMQEGYPPAVILHLDRKKYYKVLREADKGNASTFLDFVGRSIERSLIIYLNALRPDSSNERQGYITLKEATKYCNFSLEYLSLLARTGKLSAVKFNRNWMTTIQAVQTYLEEISLKKN
ncbi:Fic family protein [Leptospira vanthielii]|uniref:Fic/DOC family protein n=1 Tax=Leptospira vanthielii serovar Holland str. Waz Holland = ATCC 700522 TaxID=1218591 RepID=N1WCR5_9LEPT|nr:Fic family protein [Leptospira vanthielii]EMY71215.1 Fic/DOC family protein [Leptospira vanthielii serovar Holland str. Waz Holland = ATCC 700522]